MNNEELKIKITAILQSRPFENGCCKYVEIGYITALNIADALIAAGIGDVKEAEHRAEVAEKALYNACKHFCQFIVPCPNNDCKRIFCNKQKYGCYHEYFLQKAEKELAEEGKDENY